MELLKSLKLRSDPAGIIWKPRWSKTNRRPHCADNLLTGVADDRIIDHEQMHISRSLCSPFFRRCSLELAVCSSSPGSCWRRATIGCHFTVLEKLPQAVALKESREEIRKKSRQEPFSKISRISIVTWHCKSSCKCPSSSWVSRPCYRLIFRIDTEYCCCTFNFNLQVRKKECDLDWVRCDYTPHQPYFLILGQISL